MKLLQEPIILQSLFLTYKSSENKENADHNPGLYRCEAFRLGNIGSDGVENVHQNKEHSDQERHPPRHYVGGDEEADP